MAKHDAPIEPYDAVEVPKARVADFLNEPFSMLWEAALREEFPRYPHTVEINCGSGKALLRSCHWTDKPIILRQNW